MSSVNSKTAIVKSGEVGFPSKYFVNRPPDSLLCGLCLEVLNNPFQCSNGHCFCKECITEALELRSVCPICNVSTPSFSNYNANIVARDVIEYLPSRCHTEHVKVGNSDFCPWTGPFQQRSSHVAKCQYQLTECRNPDCSVRVPKNQLNHHILNECSKRSIRCEYCSRTVIYDTLNQHHKNCTERLAVKSGQLKSALHVGQSAPVVFHDADIDTNGLTIGTSTSKSDSKIDTKTSSPTRRKKLEHVADNGVKTTKSNDPTVVPSKSNKSSFRLSIVAALSAIVIGVAAKYQLSAMKEHFPHDPNIKTFSDNVMYFKYFLYRYLNPNAHECANGYCMFQFESNDIYIGHWKDFSTHGLGYYQFNSSGDVYVGNFDQDRMHGYGVYTGRLGTYDGDWFYGTRSGRAVFSYPNGDVYNGTFHENMFNGWGNLTYSGSQYIGHFYNDMFHGGGEFYFPNGDKYQGDWEFNARTGHGVMVYADSSEYVGDFRDNQRSGQGRMTWSSGDMYEGGFANDMMDGPGVMWYATGDEYRGDWHANMRHGYGEFRAKHVNYVYEGHWFENLRHGTGKMWNEVGMYEGDFTEDAVSGQGTYTYHENSVYSGGVKDGLRHGSGVYYSSSGEVYEGMWNADRLSGECRVRYPNGDLYIGTCQDMSLIKGTLQYANGDQYEGEFFNNQKHGVGRYYTDSTGETYYGHFQYDERFGEGQVIDAKGKVISGGGGGVSGLDGVRKTGTISAGGGSKHGGPTARHSSMTGQKPITGHKRRSTPSPN